MPSPNATDPLHDLYLRCAGRLLAQLIARLRQLDRAEDALAEAFAEAAKHWPSQGWPQQPEAWLFRTALRHDLDQLKGQKTRERFAEAVQHHEANREKADSESEARDRLALFFLCAHPSLSPDTQAMLMLRYCALVPPAGIARAFQLDADTLTRRLTRAKRKLETAGISFELPAAELWPERLPALLAALEVLYDQSYADLAGGPEVEALARDALQLLRQLLELIPNEAEVWGLAALICFAESRRPARLDANGIMIPLDQQEPNLWNRALIQRGARYLLTAAKLRQPGPYQWRASISAAHARRLELGHTPWADVLTAYRALSNLDDTPVLQINWAMAEATAGQIDSGWQRIEALQVRELQHLCPYWLARAELQWLRHARVPAIQDLQRALSLASGQAETRFLEQKLARWQQSSRPAES